MLFSNKQKIRFIRGNFTSPILGNVWAGRVATVPKATAKHFIDQGYAELAEDKEQETHENEKPVDDVQDEKPAETEDVKENSEPAGEAPAEKPQKSKDKKHGRGHKSK